LFVNLGRRDGVRVADLVQLFEAHAGLTKEEIGRIRVRDRHSFVDVPLDRAERVIQALTGQRAHEKALVVELARVERARNDAAPESPAQSSDR
jgi:ATP-dependent RNA helicase DeaD